MSPQYRIELERAAARALHKLDPPARTRIAAAIDLLAENPRPPGARKLAGGDGELRVRTGDYRIIYEVRESALVILVITIGHRRDIYRSI